MNTAWMIVKICLEFSYPITNSPKHEQHLQWSFSVHRFFFHIMQQNKEDVFSGFCGNNVIRLWSSQLSLCSVTCWYQHFGGTRFPPLLGCSAFAIPINVPTGTDQDPFPLPLPCTQANSTIATCLYNMSTSSQHLLSPWRCNSIFQRNAGIHVLYYMVPQPRDQNRNKNCYMKDIN